MESVKDDSLTDIFGPLDPPKRKRARKGVRCPQCGHGLKGGHSGRQCIALVGGTYPDYEYDACGCKYDQRKENPE